jgi:hypothetical protein
MTNLTHVNASIYSYIRKAGWTFLEYGNIWMKNGFTMTDIRFQDIYVHEGIEGLIKRLDNGNLIVLDWNK